jgi:hypothetical protein
MDKVKVILKAVYESPKVRLAFKGLLIAVAGVVAGVLGFNTEVIVGLLG